MAPNRKKGGRNNNKRGRSTANASSDSSGLQGVLGPLRTFHSNKNGPTGGLDSIQKGDMYERYKAATKRFVDWMRETLPSVKMTGVNDLGKGVEVILKHHVDCLDKVSLPDPSFVPTKEILHELQTSIEIREKFTNYFHGKLGGDGGHKHMLIVLKYCRSVLRFGKHIARISLKIFREENPTVKVQGDHDVNSIGGRFNALLLEEEEEEDEEEDEANISEDDIRNMRLPTFTKPKLPEEEIDIETDLINGDDRFQAMALLFTMDHLMDAIEQHYGVLKRVLRKQDLHQGSIVQLIMECAVVVNMSTESIVAAEATLALDHPHLSSFFHVLALIFLTNDVAELKAMIPKSKLDEDPHMALHFVAQVVESCFHNRGHERLLPKVKLFVKKSGLRLSVVENQARTIQMQTQVEVMLAKDEQIPENQRIQQLLRHTGVHPHMWFERNSRSIGGDRCILNTQNIVQKIMDLVQDNKKLVGRPGFWGLTFDESVMNAKRIRGDLDEAFAANILPELIAICTKAPFGNLPERSQLITIIDLLEQHVKGDRTRSVPIALTFGLHAILTSIFVLQGNGDLSLIAACTKQSYHALFLQLDSLSDQNTPPENTPNFYMNVGLFKNVANFAKPVESNVKTRLTFMDPKLSERFAFWNPVIGGEYLLYATYVCSIGLGSATVDTAGQLRFTLHLYNALKTRDTSFTIPFLEDVDDVFTKTKAIWEGGRPEQGSFGKRFWLSWGMSASEASRFASNEYTLPNSFTDEHRRRGRDMRALEEIHPEEFSASYRRLVLRNFQDDDNVVDFTVQNWSNEAKGRFEILSDVMTRVNITRDSMDDDEDNVLPINFTAVGCILLEFTNALSAYMDWDDLIVRTVNEFNGETRTAGKALDASGTNFNFIRQGMAHVWGNLLCRLDNVGQADTVEDMVKRFMQNFFVAIPSDRYRFFVEPGELKAERRDPLEGSYPYGRTGKTPRDPLNGFFHFKYSKSGNPVARLIKPGNYTPFSPVRDWEDVATPYEEKGSLMPRLPNGKYRHIASYSLDELIELGWDGAKYTSKTLSGQWVPFIQGYDSDSDDEYEAVNQKVGKQAGIIGLPPSDDGLYMSIPKMSNEGRGFNLVRLKAFR